MNMFIAVNQQIRLRTLMSMNRGSGALEKSKATRNVQGSSCIEAGVEYIRLSPEPMVSMSHDEYG